MSLSKVNIFPEYPTNAKSPLVTHDLLRDNWDKWFRIPRGFLLFPLLSGAKGLGNWGQHVLPPPQATTLRKVHYLGTLQQGSEPVFLISSSEVTSSLVSRDLNSIILSAL